MPMGAAPMACALWLRHLRHNPSDPGWSDRDRFVLSAGHGSMLLYSLLYLSGYGLSLDELKDFRQSGSRTPGHPEYGHTPGVETTTGPLGQGVANAVGMAVAETVLAAKFNKKRFPLFDHYTYAICGDGDLMEGVSAEAASLAGHLKLGKLIVMYDDNEISIDGSTDLAFTEDVPKRFKSYGWQVIKVEDGNSLDEIDKAITAAKEEKEKPTLIVVPTEIGYGSPKKQGTSSAHGEPLGEEELLAAKRNLGWESEEMFYVPEEVSAYVNFLNANWKKEAAGWEKMLAGYGEEYPELHAEYLRWKGSVLPDDFRELVFGAGADGNIDTATRNSSGEILNLIAEHVPNLVGGSADLAPSNKTFLKGKGEYSPENRLGPNFHFGVREHAMGSILNGMALHGGLRVYGGTFLIFSDYMRPAIRLAALMNQPVTYVFTHDSIGLGEDGPTHQPVEQLPSLRIIPNLKVIRPCDYREVSGAWYTAMESEGPVALILSRQTLPAIANSSRQKTCRGGYIISESRKPVPDMILMGSGSEVSLLIEVKKRLEQEGSGVRVVSMPCMEIFDAQDEEYREKVLPAEVTKRFAAEAAHPGSWYKYSGTGGKVFGIETFGASAPAPDLFEEYGFTVENIYREASQLLR